MWVDLHQKTHYPQEKDNKKALNDKMDKGTNFAFLNGNPRYFGLSDMGDPF